MKIRGYVDYHYRPPAPFVKVLALFEELSLETRLLFMLDTGASSSIVLWGDVERLRINTSLLREEERDFVGLGGFVKAKATPTVVKFLTEKGKLLEEKIELFVVSSACPHPRLKLLPNVLGRDLINKFNLLYNVRVGEVYLEK